MSLPTVLLTKWTEYECKRNDTFIENVCSLIAFRMKIFRMKFKELDKDLEFFKGNDVNFVHYIRENMNKYFPYPRMNIFDKIFMSCAVVARLSLVLHRFKLHEFCAPQIWLMYFEKELKEFYVEENCWKKLKKYAKDSSTCIVKHWSDASLRKIMFLTDFELAEHVYIGSQRTYNYSVIIETFKQRINRPLGSFCCSECLPLFDALYYLTFGEKLVSDFQLVEGFTQIFLRMLYGDEIETLDPEAKVAASWLFHDYIFKNKEYNSEGVHGSYNCMFCKDKKEKDVVSLKSIHCRTVSEEATAYREENKGGLRRFLVC